MLRPNLLLVRWILLRLSVPEAISSHFRMYCTNIGSRFFEIQVLEMDVIVRYQKLKFW